MEAELRARFPVTSFRVHNPRRWYVVVPRESIGALARWLATERGARLATATAADLGPTLEMTYHFSLDASGTMVSVRTEVPKADPRLDSVAAFLPAANWIEREVFDLLGIVFVGHPNLTRLLSSEDRPPDWHPLRRDAPWWDEDGTACGCDRGDP